MDAIGRPTPFELPTAVVYTCPGESHPITRSVHLARLAAFYPGCRDCPHRHETGQLAPTTVERLQSTERRAPRPTLFTPDGVRGVHLNELTRPRAAEIAAAFASVLWDNLPIRGHAGNDSPATFASAKGRRNGPTVVIGYDERPSSPDIVTGVSASLRRMGCDVIDLGLTTRPCLRFTVDHLQSAAGVFVTGAGCEPTWTGLDFVGRRGLPYSHGTGLERIEARLAEGVQRPVRRAGTQHTFRAGVPYEAGLWKHFHALRPLQVCCACPIPMVRGILDRLFGRLPCRLDWLPLTQRRSSTNDSDLQRLREAVRTGRHHLGLLIDDDGQRTAFVDEQGELVSPRDMFALLLQMHLAEDPGRPIAVEQSALAELQPVIAAAGGETVDGGSTQGEMAAAMDKSGAPCGGGDSGRLWFHESFPACDAILTLGKVLQALSRSDASFSEVVPRHAPH